MNIQAEPILNDGGLQGVYLASGGAEAIVSRAADGLAS